MNSTVIVALISFAGTLLGTAGGIFASSKLTDYRLSQLEKKMESYSALTTRLPVIEEKIKNFDMTKKRQEMFYDNWKRIFEDAR